ncbi:spondin domain-containing protein [Candidatus Micrarchaeota archaeon]|nr:spondin domain-containing protein [Candidatus Micrarchaeota archaeon]
MRLLFLLSVLLVFGCVSEEPQQTNEMDEKLMELEQHIEDVEDSVEELKEKIGALEEKINEMENGEIAEAEEEKQEGFAYFSVTVQNVHDSQALSPGVFVIHKPAASINYFGKTIPEELRPLAEYGNHTVFSEYVKGLAGVEAVYTLDEPLAPGESRTFIIKSSTYRPRESYFSGIQMLAGTNDGYALASNIALFTVGNGPRASTTMAGNYDAGTEENSAPGSGFDGGQPDPDRGDENIGNGIPTIPQRPVTKHPQITNTVMKIIVVPVD